MVEVASPKGTPESADASRDGSKANWCDSLRAESKKTQHEVRLDSCKRRESGMLQARPGTMKAF